MEDSLAAIYIIHMYYAFIKPTCANCMVGSYVSLSVRLSVRPSVCHTFNNSYLRQYYRYESETLLQYKAFIGASRKNTDYTLKNVFVVNK